MYRSRSFKVVIFASLCALGGVALIVISALTIEEKGAELEEKMQQVADTEAHQQEYLALMDELSETEEERTRLHGYILDRNNGTIELLSQFDTIAAALRLELVTSKLEEIEGEGEARDMLEITLTFSGTETSVQSFLEAVETVPYHGHIIAADITRSVEGETGVAKTRGTVTLALSLHNE